VCDHPNECFDVEGDCNWCEEVRNLKYQIASLREAIGKQALIINGGVVHMAVNTLSYVEINGGTFVSESSKDLPPTLTIKGPPHVDR
jgi:hypothetical protein